MRQESGYLLGESHTHHDLGVTHLALSNVDQAFKHMRRALELATTVDSGIEQAFADNGLGEINFATARFSDAADHFERALAEATASQCIDEQARAHFGLARLPGQGPDDAQEHLKCGQHLIATMQVPEPPIPTLPPG
ncbi:tetratricopeptide repeat protein [Amycolatopsis thailandensis]|uniref:tetratricopeptide repeat protein n=1 Tax=Amycolatopsis thailandensis TaxID=589330 RepID=UPI00364A577B